MVSARCGLCREIFVRDRWAIVALSGSYRGAERPDRDVLKRRAARFSETQKCNEIGDKIYQRGTNAAGRALAVGRSRSGLESSAFYRSRAIFSLDLIAIRFGWASPWGCLGIVMIITWSGNLGVRDQRSIESAIRDLSHHGRIVSTLLFGLDGFIYMGAPQAVAQDTVLMKKPVHPNIPAFIIRAAGYFAVWSHWVFLRPLVGGTGPQRRPRAHAAVTNSKDGQGGYMGSR